MFNSDVSLLIDFDQVPNGSMTSESVARVTRAALEATFGPVGLANLNVTIRSAFVRGSTTFPDRESTNAKVAALLEAEAADDG